MLNHDYRNISSKSRKKTFWYRLDKRLGLFEECTQSVMNPDKRSFLFLTTNYQLFKRPVSIPLWKDNSLSDRLNFPATFLVEIWNSDNSLLFLKPLFHFALFTDFRRVAGETAGSDFSLNRYCKEAMLVGLYSVELSWRRACSQSDTHKEVALTVIVSNQCTLFNSIHQAH